MVADCLISVVMRHGLLRITIAIGIPVRFQFHTEADSEPINKIEISDNQYDVQDRLLGESVFRKSLNRRGEILLRFDAQLFRLF